MSMQVEVWTRGPKPKRIWRGRLSAVPRVGEWITVRDGFCAERVHQVDYVLDEDRAVLEIETRDEPGNYPEVP